MSIGGVSSAGFDFAAMRARFQENAMAKFEAADADKSGGLSLDEFKGIQADNPFGSAKPAGAPSAEEMFAKLDADGDGQLTASERPQAPGGNFSPEAFMNLLSAQEGFSTSGFGQSSMMNLLSAGSESQQSSETDLVSQLMDALTDSTDEDKA